MILYRRQAADDIHAIGVIFLVVKLSSKVAFLPLVEKRFYFILKNFLFYAIINTRKAVFK